MHYNVLKETPWHGGPIAQGLYGISILEIKRDIDIDIDLDIDITWLKDGQRGHVAGQDPEGSRE